VCPGYATVLHMEHFEATNPKSTIQIGAIGEEMARRFLAKKGFSIVESNYRKKWGEIDIIARKGSSWHFVEVKSVSCEKLPDVSSESNSYRPEENIHPKKLEKVARTAETYLLEKGIDADWQIDAIAVFLCIKDKKARCRMLENVF